MHFPTTILSGPKKQVDEALLTLLEELESPLNVNNPDHLHINQDSGWGIEVIRTIPRFLSIRSLKYKNKVVIIHDAQKLRSEAQNALLKSLEEPGKDNYFVLTCNNTRSLLPTIISRSHLVKLRRHKSELVASDIIIPPEDAQRALSLADSLGLSKEQILPFLEKQLELHQQKLTREPSAQALHLINNLVKSIQMIKANVDPFAALDWFFLA